MNWCPIPSHLSLLLRATDLSVGTDDSFGSLTARITTKFTSYSQGYLCLNRLMSARQCIQKIQGPLVRNTHNDIETQASIDFRKLDRMDADLNQDEPETINNQQTRNVSMHLSDMETN